MLKQYFINLKQILIAPLFLTLTIYLLSLVFNTSFHLMGVDIAKQVREMFQGEYIYFILKIHAKILITYLTLLVSWRITLSHILPIDKKGIYFSLYSIAFWLLFFIESLVRHPQLYGDFFYIQHPYLLPFLHYVTDNVPPTPLTIISHVLFGALTLYNLMNYSRNDLKDSFAISLFTILFISIYLFNSIWLLSFLIIAYPILVIFQEKIGLFTRIGLVTAAFMSISIKSFTDSYYSGKELQKETNIFLIAADSLRADRIGLKVNGESLTPNIDQWKKDAFSFTDHHVTIARTFPSWADTLTGEYSMSHKVRHMFPAPEEKNNIGSVGFKTIGHYLQEIGYNTAVFSNFAGDIFPRADFGFKKVFAPDFNINVIITQKSLEAQFLLLPFLTGGFLNNGKFFREIEAFPSFGDGSNLTNDLKSYVLKQKGKKNFITTFYSVAHFPYSPPYPYYKKYSKSNYKGKYKYFKFVDPTKDEQLSEEDKQQVIHIFNSAISSFDNDFGKFIEFLKDQKLYDHSIIILTGDHGETLYEDVHGHGHGDHLRGDFGTKVPLIIKFPKDSEYSKYKEMSFDGITSSIDLVPTLLDLFKVQTNKVFPGSSLLPVVGKSNWETERFVYSETEVWFSDIGEHFFQKKRIMYPNILKLHRVVPEENYQIMITDPHYREMIAFAKHREVMTNQHKLIYIPTRDGVEYELFDRIKDPLNQKNLAGSEPLVLKKLQQYLQKTAQVYESANIIEDYIIPPPIQ